MKWYHEEILKTFKERHGMTDIEVARNKKALEYYDEDEQREEYLKAIDDQFKKDLPSTFNLWEGNKYKSNILKYRKDYDGYHPTQKPILLLEDLIKTFSNKGDLVVDLTIGSGSTAVACINTNRNFIGIELDDKYFEIAKRRISEVRNKPEQITMG